MKLHRVSWQSLLIGEHCYLNTADECYFADSYETRFRCGKRNQILSLKRGDDSVIVSIAKELSSALPQEWAGAYTFASMPPSAGVSSSIKLMLKLLSVSDNRDLILQLRDTPSAHNGWRPTPQQRMELLTLNQLALDPVPRAVVIVDDVLATGAHFRAAKGIVRRRWPQMRVIGVFLARACWKAGLSGHEIPLPSRERTRFDTGGAGTYRA
jgi:hypothetical protein